MATATRVRGEDTLHYTPTSAVAAGDVVVHTGATAGSILGIAEHDIAANVEGSLAITGIFTVPKFADDAMEIGETVYWDAGNTRCTVTASTHKKLGNAVEDKAATTTTVKVRLAGTGV